MDFEALTQEVGKELERRGLVLATAESCTGGWVAQAITASPRSSSWFERGFVTYSNDSKQELLDVSPQTLARFGAVSEQTARAMADGALTRSRAQVALSITGIAGPDGGSAEKPVGTVWFAWAGANRATVCAHQLFSGNRTEIRSQAVETALRGLLRFIQS